MKKVKTIEGLIKYWKKRGPGYSGGIIKLPEAKGTNMREIKEHEYEFEERYTITGANSDDFNDFEVEFQDLLDKYGFKLVSNWSQYDFTNN